MSFGNQRRPGAGGTIGRRQGAGGGTPGKRTLTAGLQRPLPGPGRSPAAPTLDDVATEAVDTRSSGRPVDAAVRERVEGHLGADFSAVRVHDDEPAQAQTAAMGARAFAYGADVFLGPGESDGDLALMAHELTHVVQQGAGGPAPQAKVEVGAADSPAEAEADAVATAITSGAPPAQLVIDDDATPAAGQVRRTDFLARLEAATTAAVAEELGPTWSAAQCAFIARYFAAYRTRPARDAEQLLRRYARSSASTADALAAATVARVRDGIHHWRDTGRLPADLAAIDPDAAAQAEAAAPPPPGSAAAMISAMGPGQPLEAATARRMGDAFDDSFAGVTVHTGPEAARATAAEGATAMAVGEHVAFAAGAYQPGTPEGDGLLAHELAHTVQQRGASPEAQRAPLGAESAAHEDDADQATTSVLGRLWGGVKRGAAALAQRAKVALTSELQLQRCSGGTTPAMERVARREGPHRGRQVAVVARDRAMVTNERVLRAADTIGEATSESEAIAMAKVAGGATVVLVADGTFFVYRVDGLDDLDAVILGHVGLEVEGGAIALIVDGNVYREGLHHGSTATADARQAYGDPFAPYQALHAGEGGLAGLPEPELLAVFQAAMKDNALAILAESERQAAAKQRQLGAGQVTPGEQATIEATAREALAVQREIDRVEDEIAGEGMAIAHGAPLTTDTFALRDEKERLVLQRKRVDLRYPMLGRYREVADLERFLALDPAARVAQLAGDAGTVLQNIATTRADVLTDDLNLWLIPGVVDSTIAGLDLREGTPQRGWVDAKAASQERRDTGIGIALAVFSIGLGLAAAFASGGTSLVLTAGALGVGVYDAVDTTEQYFTRAAATDTDIDQVDGASLLPVEMRMHWGWLVLAWAGLGLDAFDVVKVADEVAKVGRGLQTVDEAAAALARGDAALLRRLRNAAGHMDVSDVVSEANRADVSARVGAEVQIHPTGGRSVQVRYQVDDAGRTIVTHVQVGPLATVGDILAHATTVRLLERRSGLVERARDLWTRCRSFGRAPDVNPFPPLTPAFESWLEVRKLQDLIGIKRAQLAEILGRGADESATGVAAAAETELRRQIAFLDNELDIHGRVIDTVTASRGGRGFVAMSDDTRAALEAGHRLPDFPDRAVDDLSPDDLRNSAYYFVRRDDGTFELATKPDRAVDPAAARPAAPTPAVDPAAVSAHARRVTAALPDAAGLADDALVALAGLSDEALARLARAPRADLERLATMLATDPSLAARIGRSRDLVGTLRAVDGVDPGALDARLFRDRMRRAGSTSDRIVPAVQASGVPWAQLDDLSDADIGVLSSVDRLLAQARTGARPGRGNPDLMRQAATEIEQVSSVDAAVRDRLRAALSHQNGFSDIPFALDPAAALRARFPDIPPTSMDELAQRHPDALRALESATEDDVRRVIHLLGQGTARDAEDVEDILRSYMHNAEKAFRRGEGARSGAALAPPADVATRLDGALDTLAEVRRRGFPCGFTDQAQYRRFMDALDAGLARRGINGTPAVHGSAMRSPTPGDVDVAILVDQAEFDALARRFEAAAQTRAAARKVREAVARHKIPSSLFFPGLGLPDEARLAADLALEVQATLVVRGSDFDLGPMM